MTGKQQQEDGLGGTGGAPTRQGAQYSMPGILHFLQTEWARFEMDRAQWDIDRAELQVRDERISYLAMFRMYNI